MQSSILTSTGSRKDVNPSNGSDFSLEELQDFVGGYIEIVRLSSTQLMVVNEEGKIHNLPINTNATLLYIMATGRKDTIVGDVLICETNKIK